MPYSCVLSEVGSKHGVCLLVSGSETTEGLSGATPSHSQPVLENSALQIHKMTLNNMDEVRSDFLVRLTLGAAKFLKSVGLCSALTRTEGHTTVLLAAFNSSTLTES